MGAFCSDCLTRQQYKFDEDMMREETISLLVANDQSKIEPDCQSQSNALNNQENLKSINLQENDHKHNKQAKSEKNQTNLKVMYLDDSSEDINVRQKQDENLKKQFKQQKNAVQKKKLKDQMKLLQNKKIVDLKDVNLKFFKFPKLNVMKQYFKRIFRQYEYINEFKYISTKNPKYENKRNFKKHWDTNIDSNKTKHSEIICDNNSGFHIIEKDCQCSDDKISQKVSSIESSLKDLIFPDEIK